MKGNKGGEQKGTGRRGGGKGVRKDDKEGKKGDRGGQGGEKQGHGIKVARKDKGRKEGRGTWRRVYSMTICSGCRSPATYVLQYTLEVHLTHTYRNAYCMK